MRVPARADARADRADRPFFPICNAFVTGRNVIRHLRLGASAVASAPTVAPQAPLRNGRGLGNGNVNGLIQYIICALISDTEPSC